jgi:hypothetical protein
VIQHRFAVREKAGQITADEWMGRLFAGDEKA